jgi:glycosyltransferase involved in cell wall biosynthesis
MAKYMTMLSVIVPTLNDERLLPRCFDALITATVRGVVREVIVADSGSSDGTLMIADAAGAKVVQSGPNRGRQLAEAASSAKSDWLLFLYPETALEPGWETEAESFVERATLARPRAAVFRFAIDDFGAAARRREITTAIRSRVFALPYGDQGLLISRHLYQRLQGHRSLPRFEDVDLIRRIGRRRLVWLRTRAIIDSETVQRRQTGFRKMALAFLCALRLPSWMLARFAG